MAILLTIWGVLAGFFGVMTVVVSRSKGIAMRAVLRFVGFAMIAYGCSYSVQPASTRAINIYSANRNKRRDSMHTNHLVRTSKLLAVVGLGLIGCVHARVAQPVAIKQPADTELSCQQLALEYKTNTEIAAAKIAKNEHSDTRDFWLGVFVWPGLMDLQNADGNEGNALVDRNIYLREIAKAKPCGGMEQWPTQPERYTATIPRARLT
jgi:hypothetical protein